MSTNQAPAQPIEQLALIIWLQELAAELRSSDCAELLDFDGVEAIDVLLSLLYQVAVNTLRDSGRHPASSSGLATRLAGWIYRQSAWSERLAAWRSASVAPTDVLMWPREPTHTAVLQPVAEAIRQRGTSCRLLACHAGVFETVRRRDSDAVYARGAWPSLVRQARREGLRRARRLARCGPWSPPALDHPLAERLGPAIRAGLGDMLPTVSRAVAIARAAIDAFRPRVLVAGNDLTIEGRAACRVAAQRGVSTAVFMHGSISADALQSRHCADRILVFGEGHRQELINRGRDPRGILVCGAPHLDRIPRQTGEIHPLLRARLGLRSGEPWILVATSGPGHRVSHRHHNTVIANLTRLSEALSGVPIVVKLHRKDSLAYYGREPGWTSRRNLHVIRDKARGFPGDILDWLQGCGVLLTGASTTATEAMLMNVPVITMDFCDELHGIDFIDAGATVHVETFECLETAVRRALVGRGVPAEIQPRVEAHLERSFLALDGHSAERGAEALCGPGLLER